MRGGKKFFFYKRNKNITQRRMEAREVEGEKGEARPAEFLFECRGLDPACWWPDGEAAVGSGIEVASTVMTLGPAW